MKQLGTAAVVTAMLGIAGCAGGSDAAPEPSEEKQPKSALADLDPCDVMTQQQLQTGGFDPQGTPKKRFDFEPGCTHLGDTTDVSFYKNQEETVKSYREGRSWSEFTSIKVNGRPAARAKQSGTGDDTCLTIVSAGGGVVLVDIQSADPRKPIDACAESLKIAKQIEPNLPE